MLTSVMTQHMTVDHTLFVQIPLEASLVHAFLDTHQPLEKIAQVVYEA